MYIYKYPYVNKGLRYKYKSLLKKIDKKQSQAVLYLIVINSQEQIELIHNVFFIMHYCSDTKVLGVADSKKAGISLIKDIISDIYIHKKNIYDEENYQKRF